MGMRKCKVGGPWCDRLNDRLEQEANHGRGLVEFILTDFTTGKERVLGVAHKRAEKDKGLFLNFCPFCGTNIEPKSSKRKKKP